MQQLKDWFDLGYGKREFQRDLHMAIFAAAAWAAIRIPQIQTFTWEQFSADLKTVAALAAGKFLASYVTNSKPQEPLP